MLNIFNGVYVMNAIVKRLRSKPYIVSTAVITDIKAK